MNPVAIVVGLIALGVITFFFGTTAPVVVIGAIAFAVIWMVGNFVVKLFS